MSHKYRFSFQKNEEVALITVERVPISFAAGEFSMQYQQHKLKHREMFFQHTGGTMKNAMTIAFACFTACLFVSFSAYGAGGPKTEPLPKAKTIAELAERYDSSGCADCHEDVHDEWSESLHSKSILGTPRTAPTIITAIDKGLKLFPYSGVKKDSDITVENLMMCMKCHLPQLDEATDDVAREIVATIRSWQQAYKDEDDDKAEELEETLASLNIGCMVCHNKVAIIL